MIEFGWALTDSCPGSSQHMRKGVPYHGSMELLANLTCVLSESTASCLMKGILAGYCSVESFL